MKLVTFVGDNSRPQLGLVAGSRVIDLVAAGRAANLPYSGLTDSISFLREATRGIDAVSRIEEWTRKSGWMGPSMSGLRLLAPIAAPPKIICMAANYPAHARESRRAVPDKVHNVPRFFFKPTNTIAGPYDQVNIPPELGTEIDYEGELAVAISRTGAAIPVSDVQSYIGGYLNMNDITARRIDVPGRTRLDAWDDFFDWIWGKSFDTFAPMGPYLVVDGFIPGGDIDVTTRVNGELRQQGPVADMIYSVAECVSWISRFVTLQAGDVVATGTPAGVGKASGRFLARGDIVEVEVTGLGTLRNVIG